MPHHSHDSGTRVSVSERELIARQRLRLSFVNVLVLTAIWIFLSIFVYAASVNQTMQFTDQQLRIAADDLLAHNFPPHPDGPLKPDDAGRADYFFIVWKITPSSRTLLITSAPPAVAQALKPGDADDLYADWSYKTTQIEGSPYRVLQVWSRRNPQIFLQVLDNIGDEQGILNRLLVILFLSGIIGIGLTVIGAYALGRWTLRPLLAARKREQELLSDVSHELRTPLSVLQTHLDLLLRHIDDPIGEHIPWVESIHSETKRMSRLVEDLLDMSRLETGWEFMDISRVSIHKLCGQIASLYQPLIEERGLQFDYEPPPPCYVMADPMRLRQLFLIFLDNACKYTDQGTISLKVARRANFVEVKITDTGIGMPPELLQKVTERFVRGDQARTSRTSTGLGLAIAKRIVDALQGKMTLRSTVGEGTEVTVRLNAY